MLETLLRYGSRGETVRTLQRALNAAGGSRFAMLIDDGVFGALTHHRTAEFQAAHGLVPDAIVGPKTYDALGPFLAALADHFGVELARSIERPPHVPPGVTYRLHKAPPEVDFYALTFAPLRIKGPYPSMLRSSNAHVVRPNQIHMSGPPAKKIMHVFARAAGQADVFDPLAPNPPDPHAFAFRVFARLPTYYVIKAQPRTVVVTAPDDKHLPKLPNLKGDQVIKTHRKQKANDLFDDLARAAQGGARHLVLNAHGTGGVVWIFGQSAPDLLDITNTHVWAKIAGLYDVIWMMTCHACGNRPFAKAVASTAKSYLVGATFAKPFPVRPLGHNEFSYYPRSMSVVLDPGGGAAHLPEFFHAHTRPDVPSAPRMTLRPIP